MVIGTALTVPAAIQGNGVIIGKVFGLIMREDLLALGVPVQKD